MKRNPARKPSKSPTLFKPSSEMRKHRRDVESLVLGSDIPPDVAAKLRDRARDKAGDILAEFLRSKLDLFTELHRYRPSPEVRPFYVEESLLYEGSLLHDLVEQAAAVGFRLGVERYRTEIAALVARLEKRIGLDEQRRENGKILAEEGRAALQAEADHRADKVCQIYTRIRERHPPGRLGNGAALAEVSRRLGRLPNRDKPITVQAIRKILKRRGISCR